MGNLTDKNIRGELIARYLEAETDAREEMLLAEYFAEHAPEAGEEVVARLVLAEHPEALLAASERAFAPHPSTSGRRLTLKVPQPSTSGRRLKGQWTERPDGAAGGRGPARQAAPLELRRRGRRARALPPAAPRGAGGPGLHSAGGRREPQRHSQPRPRRHRVRHRRALRGQFPGDRPPQGRKRPAIHHVQGRRYRCPVPGFNRIKQHRL